jgi:hypothetical protein
MRVKCLTGGMFLHGLHKGSLWVMGGFIQYYKSQASDTKIKVQGE